MQMFVHSWYELCRVLRTGEAELQKLTWKGLADIEKSAFHVAGVKGRTGVIY